VGPASSAAASGAAVGAPGCDVQPPAIVASSRPTARRAANPPSLRRARPASATAGGGENGLRSPLARFGRPTLAGPGRIVPGLPGPGLLAQTITSKYADHLPLYRLEDIFARHGVELSRATLCGWMASCAELLTPLYAWFSEGFDTRDLRAAKQLIDELG